MTLQLITTCHNLDEKFLNSNSFGLLLKRAQQELDELKAENVPFVHISKLKGDMAFWILENAQPQNGEAVFSC